MEEKTQHQLCREEAEGDAAPAEGQVTEAPGQEGLPQHAPGSGAVTRR